MLEKLASVLLCLFLHILRDILDLNICTDIVGIDISLHLDKVDDALEIVFSTDRQLDRHCIALQSFVKHIQNVIEVSSHNVHLVHIYHSWYLIVISLTPYCFGLWLNAALCTKNCYRTVENSQRSLDLNCKVNVTRGVDDIESMVLPIASSCSRSNCYTSLLLLCHPVHSGCTIMSFSNFMVYSGIEKDTLGSGGLTCIDMSHDTNISGVL